MSRRPHRGYSPSSSGLPLSVCGPAPGACFPRSVPGACFAVPLVPALRSSGSAASRPALFVGLSATMADLTFHVRLSSATALRLPDADQRPVTNRLNADLPVPVQRASTHARFSDHAAPRAHAPVCIAFRLRNGVGTRDMNLYEAQWLAYVVPANASLPPSQATAHGSGSMWIATPSSCRTIVSDAGLPAHCESGSYGHVVSALAHAPISTDDAGKYGAVSPAPMAALPGASAKLLPTGGVLSVPTEVVPTLTHPGGVLNLLSVAE